MLFPSFLFSNFLKQPGDNYPEIERDVGSPGCFLAGTASPPVPTCLGGNGAAGGSVQVGGFGGAPAAMGATPCHPLSQGHERATGPSPSSSPGFGIFFLLFASL